MWAQGIFCYKVVQIPQEKGQFYVGGGFLLDQIRPSAKVGAITNANLRRRCDLSPSYFWHLSCLPQVYPVIRPSGWWPEPEERRERHETWSRHCRHVCRAALTRYCVFWYRVRLYFVRWDQGVHSSCSLCVGCCALQHTHRLIVT